MSRGLRITYYIFQPNHTATLMCIRDGVDPGQTEIEIVRQNFDLLPGTYRAVTFTNDRHEHIYLMTYAITLPNQRAEEKRQRELL